MAIETAIGATLFHDPPGENCTPTIYYILSVLYSKDGLGQINMIMIMINITKA